MKKKRTYARIDRVNQQVHEILASTLLTDVDDEALRVVQITNVTVTTDLRHAKVHWITWDPEKHDAEKLAERLERASKYLRTQLGKQIKFKFTPELNFIYDESIARARRIEDLIASTQPVTEETEQDETADARAANEGADTNESAGAGEEE